jgi:hypothetical protein
MSNLEDVDDVALVGAFDELEPPKQESVIDRLRNKRREVAEDHFKDIDVPGYSGELFCRYNLLESKDLRSIGELIRKTIRNREEQAIAAGCDTLIKACQEFWVRDNGREIPVKELLDPPRPDFPVRYDIYLAEFLGYKEHLPDPPTPRSVVLGLFGGNEISMATHNADLARWMMGRGTELDDELGNF